MNLILSLLLGVFIQLYPESIAAHSINSRMPQFLCYHVLIPKSEVPRPRPSSIKIFVHMHMYVHHLFLQTKLIITIAEN